MRVVSFIFKIQRVCAGNPKRASCARSLGKPCCRYPLVLCVCPSWLARFFLFYKSGEASDGRFLEKDKKRLFLNAFSQKSAPAREKKRSAAHPPRILSFRAHFFYFFLWICGQNDQRKAGGQCEPQKAHQGNMIGCGGSGSFSANHVSPLHCSKTKREAWHNIFGGWLTKLLKDSQVEKYKLIG